MQFHQCTTLNNIDRFPGNEHGQLPRECNDMLQIWYMCKTVSPRSIIEIGFSAGQTFGLFLEAADQAQRWVSVDINYRNKSIFHDIFANCDKVDQITFIKTDSANLAMLDTFDFIMIDGDHSYEYAKNDIQKCLHMSHEHTIICVDDSQDIGVDQAIQELLLGQNDFVPFLAGSKQIFFHRAQHNAVPFLTTLQRVVEPIGFVFNFDYYGYAITKTHIPRFFEDNKSVFIDAVRSYNI